ncbi:MAG TPA: TlpA disulfide reductase family protein [Gammaproteobacteria bacterium]|nr:TlpA disulfide reductase family protein [Gammaproteobacteria bacterium]
MNVRAAASLAVAALLCLPPALALDTGDAAPALELAQLDGKPFDLAAFKGHVVVLNLWATWCEPCRKEMPALDDFYKKYRERGVVVFGLSEDDTDAAGEVRATMAAFSYPAALARGAHDNGFHMPRALPLTYVIDATGVIRAKLWPGGTQVTEENLEKAVEPLLNTK